MCAARSMDQLCSIFSFFSFIILIFFWFIEQSSLGPTPGAHDAPPLAASDDDATTSVLGHRTDPSTFTKSDRHSPSQPQNKVQPFPPGLPSRIRRKPVLPLARHLHVQSRYQPCMSMYKLNAHDVGPKKADLLWTFVPRLRVTFDPHYNSKPLMSCHWGIDPIDR